MANAIKVGGNTGDAAREVAKLMHPHFLKEEEYALPPLGLLPELSAGKVSEEMLKVLKLTDKLESELPQMLIEHKATVKALQRLVDAATAERRLEQAQFARRLMAHALTEEEVSYPAALLVGRYLKAMLAKS